MFERLAAELAALLDSAKRDERLVRFRRSFEDCSTHAYILDVGPEWFMIAVVSDRIWFDGFECVRLSDVRNLEIPDPPVDFIEEALRKRAQARPVKPAVDTAGISEILITAGSAFPLVSISHEETDPDICHIGRVLGVAGGRVSLLPIDPDAEWDDEPEDYDISDVTHIVFGGDYEGALHLVGGDCQPDR